MKNGTKIRSRLQIVKIQLMIDREISRLVRLNFKFAIWMECALTETKSPMPPKVVKSNLAIVP